MSSLSNFADQFSRKFSLKCIATTVATLITMYAFSQNTAFTIKHYNTDNGLPQNSITSSGVDKFGFYWFGTQNGLVRFDGQRFRVFNMANTSAIKETDRIRKICADKEGNLFFDTYVGDVYEIMLNSVHRLNGADRSLVLTVNDGMIEQNVISTLKKFWQKAQLPDYNYSIYKINSKEYYILGDSILYLNVDDGLHAMCVKSNTIIFNDTVLHLENNGKLMLFNPGLKMSRVCRFEGDIIKDKQYNSIHSMSLIVTRDLKIIKVANKFYTFSVEGNCLVTKLLFDNFPLADIGTYDNLHDQYFIGTISDGFFLVKPKMFRVVNEVLSSSYTLKNTFNSQILLPGDSILCSRGIMFNRKGQQIKATNNQSIAGISDSGNTYWYSENNNIYKMSLTNLQLVYINNTNEQVNLFCKNILTGTVFCASSKKIYEINQKNQKLIPISISAFSDETIWHIGIKSNDEIWIGTSNGLYTLNVKKLDLLKIKNSDGKTIRNVLNDFANNVAWAGSYGSGAFYVKNNEMFPLPLDKAKNLLYAHYFVKDKNGFMWIPTNNGLYQVKTESLIDFINHKQNDIYYQRYSTRDGFASNEFNGGFSSPWLMKKDGTLSLCNMQGLVWFIPEKIIAEQPSGPLFIDKISVNSIDTVFKGLIALPSSYGQFSIGLTTPFFGNRENLRIQYQIEGHSKKWIDAPADNVINLDRFKHGDYKLHVRCRKGFNNDFVYTSLSFKILPSWYEELWFFILITFIFILIVIGAFKIRLRTLLQRKAELELEVANRISATHKTLEDYKIINDQYKSVQGQLLENDRVKEEMIAIILHDIYSPINFVFSTAKNVSQSKDIYSNKEIFDVLNVIAVTSNGVLGIADDLMYRLQKLEEGFKVNINKVDLLSLLKNVHILYKGIATQRSNEVSLDCPKDCFIETDATALTFIVRNIVDNANKNTRNGQINIKCSLIKSKQMVSILISDNGKGIEKKKIDILTKTRGTKPLRQGALGLKLVFEFADLICAKIIFESTLKKGTMVEIILPQIFPAHMDKE